jgi:hypothetical protein
MASAVGAPSALAAPAEVGYALSGTNLLTFGVAKPSGATSRPITGITAGETLRGIDVRPQNGMLYGLGVNATTNTATLYAIGRQTAVAAVVGSTPSAVAFTTNGATPVDLPAGEFGLDFNPGADRVRVTTASGLNFRINPNTGLGVDGDNTGLTSGTVTGTNPDGSQNGATTTVSGSAYTNNRPNNANVTTLYGLTSATDQLTIQNPPNVGTQTAPISVTLGGSALNFTSAGGFDIASGVNVPISNQPVAAGAGYAALAVGGSTRLYTVDLVTGAATDLGTIGNGTLPVQGLALQRDFDEVGFPVMALSGSSLVRFGSKVPGTTTTVPLGAPAAGEAIVGVSLRPQTGGLYALGVNATTDTATLYLVDPENGAVTAIGATGSIAFVNAAAATVNFPAASAGWGIDFNPTVDRLRVVANGGLNFRVNPNNGAPVDGNLNSGTPAGTNPDGPHSALPGGATGVTAVSYTNAYPQMLANLPTTQYVLEPTSNQLFVQNPPNAGTLTLGRTVTLNGAPLDFAATAGLDIPSEVAVATSNAPATGDALAVMTVGGVTSLFRLNLATAGATIVGPLFPGTSSLAVGEAQRDLPDPPPPTPPPFRPPIASLDRIAPVLARPVATSPLTVPRKARTLAVRARTSCNEACAIKVTGTLRIAAPKPQPGRRRGKARVIKLGSATRTLRAGVRTRLGVRIGTKNLARVRRALAQRRKVTVALSFIARDAAGNTSTKRSARVVLRKPRKR